MFQILRAFLLLLIFDSTYCVHSQENDPCVTSDKKLIKLLASAMAEENFDDKTEKFAQAIQKYPDNAETYYLFARLCEQEGARLATDVKTRNQGESVKKKALYFYQATIKKCPNFHADCYYNIGIELLSNGDVKNALPFLKKFVEFPEDNYAILPQDFIQKKTELSAIIEDIEFEKNLRENPVPFSPSKLMNVSSNQDEYFPMIDLFHAKS
jgi:tetratricopeptide (TPR) repeat protein